MKKRKKGKGKRGRKPVILSFFVFFSFEKVELQKKAIGIDFFMLKQNMNRERESELLLQPFNWHKKLYQNT